MHEQDATPDVGDARDKRPPSLGLGRIIIALFWLLGAWIFVTAIVDLFHGQGKPWGAADRCTPGWHRLPRRRNGPDPQWQAHATGRLGDHRPVDRCTDHPVGRFPRSGRTQRCALGVDRHGRGLLLSAAACFPHWGRVDVAFESAQDRVARRTSRALEFAVEGVLTTVSSLR